MVSILLSVFDSSRLFTEIFLEDFKKQFPESVCKHLLGSLEVTHFMKNTDELLSYDHIDAALDKYKWLRLFDKTCLYFNFFKNL